MFTLRKFTLMLCSLALVGQMAGADVLGRVTLKDLEKQGVVTRNFSVFHVAGDGRTILAADEPTFLQKKKGVFHRLWLLKLTADLKLESAQGYDLSVPSLEQANFAPGLDKVVFSSRRGADIHLLDLSSGKVEDLCTHVAGQPGFRIHSDVFSLYAGKLYTIGYFYDEQDYTGPEQMVEIDVTRSGKAAFTPVADMDPITKKVSRLKVQSTLHPQGMLFYADEGEAGWKVYHWGPDSGLEKIDEGKKILGSWGEGTMGVYLIRRESGNEMVLANGQTGSKNVVHSGRELLVNPCLAKDGNTIVVAKDDKGEKVDFWVARDLDGFKPRPLASQLWRSTVRISHDGSVVCLYNGVDGLHLFKLEP